MLIIHNFNVKSNIINCILYLLLLMILVKIFTNTHLVDLLFRLKINEIFINSFHFFWTNLWYLHTFFIILVYISLFYTFKYYNKFLFLFYTFLLLILFVIFFEFYNNNFIADELMLFSEGNNVLLKNSVNKIHPLLLYSSIIFFFRYFTLSYSNLNFKSSFFLSYIHSLLVYNFKLCLLFILTALYLGSWWALQEGSWGGWWNWDPSEFFGLIILFFSTILIHNQMYLKSPLSNFLYVYKALILIFIFFLLLQLNFSVTSHNFGFRSITFLNPNIILYTLIIISFIFYTFNILSISGLLTKLSFWRLSLTSLNNILFIIYILFIYVILTLLLSSIIQNFSILITFHNLLLILFSIVLLKSFISNFFKNFIYLFFNYKFIILHFTNLNINHKVKFYFHFTILLLLIINNLYNNNVTNNFILTDIVNPSSFSHFFSINLSELVLDLNFIINSTTFEGKSFNLELNNNYLSQVYILNSNNFSFLNNSLDSLSCLLNYIVLIYCVMLIIYISKPQFILL